MSKLLSMIRKALTGKPSSKQLSYLEAQQMHGLTRDDLDSDVLKMLEDTDNYRVWFDLYTDLRAGVTSGTAYAQWKTARKVDGLWIPDNPATFPIRYSHTAPSLSD